MKLLENNQFRRFVRDHGNASGDGNDAMTMMTTMANVGKKVWAPGLSEALPPPFPPPRPPPKASQKALLQASQSTRHIVKTAAKRVAGKGAVVSPVNMGRDLTSLSSRSDRAASWKIEAVDEDEEGSSPLSSPASAPSVLSGRQVGAGVIMVRPSSGGAVGGRGRGGATAVIAVRPPSGGVEDGRTGGAATAP